MDHKKLNIFIHYIRDKQKVIVINGLLLIVYFFVFFLYSLEIEALIYGAMISAFIAFTFMSVDFYQYAQRHSSFLEIQNASNIQDIKLPKPRNLIEEDYQRVIERIANENHRISVKFDRMESEMMDYYTLWAHQIKTPIAAIRLIWQTYPDLFAEHRQKESKDIKIQMFKIEQYVEMVLGYLRIENSTTDFAFGEYQLENILKQAIRKFANMFISKKIQLDLGEIDYIVMTDEKWLLFVVEQILSNALKYTKEGKISIFMDEKEKDTLVISDTGIGIEREDLPRIFEKGFTGFNGRKDKKSTGIGLYLTGKVLKKLSHPIEIHSKVNVGTRVKVHLKRQEVINKE